MTATLGGLDTAPPDTLITGAPLAVTSLTAANFTFSSTKAGSSFACSIDAGAFTACASPTNYSGLAIGKTLSERGAQVEVLPMRELKDLSPYRAVVAGSAINGGEWLTEALQFVRAYQAELRRKPFAAFQVCMTLAMRNAEQYRSHVATWMEPVRTLVKPVSEGLFAGALDISKIPSFSDRLKFRRSVAFGVWKEGDHRDWAAIRLWAESQVPVLS